MEGYENIANIANIARDPEVSLFSSYSPTQDREPTDLLPGEALTEYVARKISEARARGWCEEVVADPECERLTPQQQIQRALEEYAADPRMFRAKDGNFFMKAKEDV